MGQNNEHKGLQHAHIVMIYLVIYDIVAVSLSYFMALWLRFDLRYSAIPAEYLTAWKKFALIYAGLCVVIFWLFRLYRSIWRFASFKELERITVATLITTVAHIILITILFQRMPISYYMMGACLQFVLVTAVRFAYRFVLLLRASGRLKSADNCMLIGAGAAGAVILRELDRSKELNDKVVCIIDDNRNKWNRYIDGIPVVGGRDMIPDAVKEYGVTKIYLAIPSISSKERKQILDICKETDCELMTLPGMYQLMLGKVTVNSLRKVEVEDLLGREPVKMDSHERREFLAGKTVLVTGGGGSIGSELCRQVASVRGLERLIIFDIYENNAHAIKLELMDKFPGLDLVVLIGSVRNSRRVEQVFAEYRPDIVFHAAAHKHVPLMEDSPCEAIKNNAIGTYHVAYAAMLYGCEKFVLISTDKAVNPVNIMGASKRLCEMIVQTFARKIEEGKASELPDLRTHRDDDCADLSRRVEDHPRTEFVAVRFGNVLGSNGSVIPRFQEQIAAGGPVTVTHPDIIRYFMTIPEAASLVLTAATFGGGGKIFVLDMGTPVKIDDLARNMIRLSGLKPDEDIKIIYTGLRPGEKLYEERLMDEEGLQSTANELINIGSPIRFDEDAFLEQLKELMDAAYEDREDIRDLVADVVPTYRPAGRYGSEIKGVAYQRQRAAMANRQADGGRK